MSCHPSESKITNENLFSVGDELEGRRDTCFKDLMDMK